MEGWNAVYAEGVSLQLKRLAAELEVDGVSIVPRIVAGPITATIADVARRVEADLIACGASNLNAFERLLVGYPPLELLRRAERSVLIAPQTSSANATKESL